MELQQAITKMEQGGSADGILQVSPLAGIPRTESGVFHTLRPFEFVFQMHSWF